MASLLSLSVHLSIISPVTHVSIIPLCPLIGTHHCLSFSLLYRLSLSSPLSSLSLFLCFSMAVSLYLSASIRLSLFLSLSLPSFPHSLPLPLSLSLSLSHFPSYFPSLFIPEPLCPSSSSRSRLHPSVHQSILRPIPSCGICSSSSSPWGKKSLLRLNSNQHPR